MTIHFRHYHHPDDYQRVNDFLITHHQPGNMDGNWLAPAWKYMHFHSMLDSQSLGKIGIWEDNGDMVAVCHYETRLGESYFQFHPGYRHLRDDMLDYAEANLSGISNQDGKKYLRAFVHEDDAQFLELVMKRGYQEEPQATRPLYRFDTAEPFPSITLPEGFRLTSLSVDYSHGKATINPARVSTESAHELDQYKKAQRDEEAKAQRAKMGKSKWKEFGRLRKNTTPLLPK